MHMDMSGGAAVIHAVALAAKLGVKRNVIGLVPAVENMPSGTSYRPGDVLVSMSGKTIEVLNTDAEGRIILADAITYSRKYNPSIVVEASTLTGAVLIALGQQASAVLSRDEKLVDNLRELGEESGDYVWPLPLWEEYEPMVKGNFGDISNIPANGNSRYGGVIGGGMFLQQFAEGLRFAHLDIASRMTAAPGEHLAKGAAGAPVRLFLAICENL
jgi:leucyl aminopeptidase